MTGKPQQLVFNLLHRPAMGREDFLVTESNAAAVALVDSWPNWTTTAAVLTGPQGSGKSHLVEVWRTATGARRIEAQNLTTENAPLLLDTGAIAMEDVKPEGFDERALFHLLNLSRQLVMTVLLTSQFHPDQWGVKLPDLRSRLKATPVVDILLPDDTLLRAVLVKLFTDRQINLREEVISFILARMPRSLAAARLLVSEIDRQAMIARAEITRPFVSRIMKELELSEELGYDEKLLHEAVTKPY